MYKITREDLSSAIANGQAKVYYDVGEWVSAPAWLNKQGFGLTVFKDVKDAVSFHQVERWDATLLIWECEVDGLLPRHDYCSLGKLKDKDIDRLLLVWREGYDLWPAGTMFYKRVKLIRQLSVEEIEHITKEERGW
jgi:hypothetical protein